MFVEIMFHNILNHELKSHNNRIIYCILEAEITLKMLVIHTNAHELSKKIFRSCK